MADTIGGLIDKLITTNTKLWFVQDIVHKAAAKGEGIDADTTQKLAVLNLQRNGLMGEIDSCLEKAIQTGVVDVDPRIKLT